MEAQSLQVFIEFIEALGWEEHTCDWDIGLLITLRNGLLIDTGQGYCNFEIRDMKLVIEQEDEEEIIVSISAVREIKL